MSRSSQMMIGDLFYQDCQPIIDDEGSEFSVAEVHGIMSGMLCVDPSLGFEDWHNEIGSARIVTDHFYGRC